MSSVHNTSKVSYDLNGDSKYLPKFSVAPMMDWTDRHCRFFHRQITKQGLLFTEMVVADAAIHGIREQLLGFSEEEHPIAIQLGGSDSYKLAEAAKIAEDFGYDEINLNVGCPSDRVQSGSFGACLMKEPELVGRLVYSLKKAVTIPVTVKCRISIDDQPVPDMLNILGDNLIDNGVDALWVHARSAWLQGLSPKENRDIPQLDYQAVYGFKQRHPNVFIGLNGGIQTIEEMKGHLQHIDAVMVGRKAYKDPSILQHVDANFYNAPAETLNYENLIEIMVEYADKHIANGGKLNHISRHMIDLFTGYSGARTWRRILSNEATKENAMGSLFREAFKYVDLSNVDQ